MKAKEIVFEIIKETLGLKHLDLNSRFLDIGGNSLNLAEIKSRIKNQTGVDVEAKMFFSKETSSIGNICDEVGRAKKETSYKLTNDEIRFFHKNGYVGPFKLFEPEEMDEIWNELRVELLDKRKAPFPDSKLNYDRHLDIEILSYITSHPRVVERVNSILGPDILNWRTEWFPKYPGDEGTEWHQAQSFVEFEGTEKLVPTKPEQGQPWELTAWFAMNRATKENGCMKVMPGTHNTWYFDEKKNINFTPEDINNKTARNGEKSGFYGYDFSKLKHDENWEPDETQALHIEMEPGEFFLFTSRCMHASNPNITENMNRFGLASRYVPTHVKVYPETNEFCHFGEKFSLDRYSPVLVSGRNSYDHNITSSPISNVD
ncbi:chlorinating enzyme [Vibrio mediterranei]|uniref:chlorinating enzyme n=1 Tax=Vibrio mediterranei TaxID=689 RepID=UPI001EFD7322|nr:chlorinating enzyme [Vibrio mediterranei]MCG9629023.1 chlorinating enzyme [Vibrio mediterranei]